MKLKKGTDYKARVFDLLQAKKTELTRLQNLVSEADDTISRLEGQMNNTSVTGDFELFKKTRTELLEIKDLRQAYCERIEYLKNHAPITEDEISEIVSAIHKDHQRLEADTLDKMGKIIPMLQTILDDYEKERQEQNDIVSAWNKLSDKDHQISFSIGTINIGRSVNDAIRYLQH